MRQDDYLRAQLVTVGWQWGAEYGGHHAPILIMNIVANRTRKGWGSWLEVINRIPQFSAQLDPPVLVIPQIWDPLFIQLLHVVEGIYDGTTKDTSNGALYWADLRRVDNEWFKTKIIGDPIEHARIGDMNTLTFFR